MLLQLLCQLEVIESVSGIAERLVTILLDEEAIVILSYNFLRAMKVVSIRKKIERVGAYMCYTAIR